MEYETSDSTASRYREFAPPPGLSDRVACMWRQTTCGPASHHVHAVVPDGCADIVWIGDSAPLVAGPATRTIMAHLPVGAPVFGVRLRSGWAGPSLGLPADRLQDLEAPLREVWGAAVDGYARPAATEHGVPVFDVGLLARLADAPLPSDCVRVAVPWLARHPRGEIGELVGLLSSTERTLRRHFRDAVGYGPKTFQRIARFQGLLARARRPDAERWSLTDLALASGFADHAHMCREIVALSGRTPSDLLPSGDRG